MRGRVLSVLAGLALGGLLAAGGIALAPRAETASGETTTTAARAAVWWHDPHETIVGTAAIVLHELRVDRGHAVLEYRVLPITATPWFDDETSRTVAPERWVLLTTEGPIEASSTSFRSTSVRFRVDADFSAEQVTGVRLVGYRTRIPYTFDVVLPLESGAGAQLDDETSVAILSVLPQASSVGVGVGIEQPADGFTALGGQFFDDSVQVVPRDSGWRGPDFRTPRPPYSHSFQLTWREPEPPPTITLQVAVSRWFTHQANIDVDIRGLGGG